MREKLPLLYLYLVSNDFFCERQVINQYTKINVHNQVLGFFNNFSFFFFFFANTRVLPQKQMLQGFPLHLEFWAYI